MISPQLLAQLLQFREARAWKQFHTPRNVAAAISVEAAELLEHFVWGAPGEDEAIIQRHRTAIEHEVADLAILLSYFARDLGIDIEVAVSDKLRLNGEKYPVATARGSNRKYSDRS